ncbi:MAG: LPS export ABC transporter ATP-binding protein [Gammaproteobacteria bacterium]|nr:LPS export ABC transporter ATP-binding protein [Gammaproteobacteria bacterium]MDD9808111.1 LPS export ABC transporter ATP-binding protein [Gammaproteobacteria bacterium]MDD9868924.1 LPS export ABC transporter ATP-binding protein [Gammaproteobacteria bacterium]MDD9885614.1 LPS export ABC transporter ATP-binding protein [Gammaproteobacteria bacterium]
MPKKGHFLEATGLSKRYGAHQAVESVSLRLAGSEIVGLLGPNGAGKTTTFHMIVGLIRADSGRTELNGADISSLPMHERAARGIGYLPQESSVFRRMSVEDNIRAALETCPAMTPDVMQHRLEQLLDELQLHGVRRQPGISLSGGECHRVEIARLLATGPAFMLLDEPFAGIDPISVAEVQKLMLQLKRRGIGLLVTDHNVRETLKICDRGYIFNRGRIIARGTPEEILADETVREVYLGSDFRI